jgi:D-arabinose 1-dehydrogenase-like Zn-dependent alcohol dehydrogenase
MGSKKDMIDATNFMAQHKLVPVVSHVLKGLESAEEGFQALDNANHFGKIVIAMESELTTRL